MPVHSDENCDNIRRYCSFDKCDGCYYCCPVHRDNCLHCGCDEEEDCGDCLCHSSEETDDAELRRDEARQMGNIS